MARVGSSFRPVWLLSGGWLAAALLVHAGVAAAQTTGAGGSTTDTAAPAGTDGYTGYDTTTETPSTEAAPTDTAPAASEQAPVYEAPANSDAEYTPAPSSVIRPKTDEKQTDHEFVVGQFGLGLLGTETFEFVGNNSNLEGDSSESVGVPVIGVRHWLSNRFGVQGGLGMRITDRHRANDQAGGVDTGEGNIYAFMLNGGLPIALVADKHYTFLLLPEVSIGHGMRNLRGNENTATDDVEQRVWAFGAGLRAGAEIQMGFIGIPRLSLQGTVGVQWRSTYSSVKDLEGGTQDDKGWRWDHSLGTTAEAGNLWDYISSTIGLLYYFDV